MLTKPLLIVLAGLSLVACSSPAESPGDATETADDAGLDAAPEAADLSIEADLARPDADDAAGHDATLPDAPEPADDADAGPDLPEAGPEGAEPPPEMVDAAPDQDVDPPTCEVTAPDVQGPYYVEGAPWTSDLADADEPGQRLALSGTVRGADCTPLPGAVLDVWQADATGTYDETPGSWHLRGRSKADAAGRWSLTTIVPGRYLQASGYRPAHLHFKVSADGHAPLTTQLYFAGDPYLHPNDSCPSCGSDEPTLIIPLTPGIGANAGSSTGQWNMVLGSGEI